MLVAIITCIAAIASIVLGVREFKQAKAASSERMPLQRSSIAWVDLLHYRSAVRYRGSRRRAPSPPSSLTAAHRTRVQNALPENVYIFLSG